MSQEKEIKKAEQNNVSKKMVWQLPELVDLDINEATQFQAMGASINDGGNAFNDYNS
jgi:hypothetical protein